MRAFTTDELSRMQGTQESAMQDRCQLYALQQGAADDYGYPAETWVLLYAGECGLKPVARGEAMDGTQVNMHDAKLRLPLEQEANAASTARVILTHRYGEALDTTVMYATNSAPERGPSGVVLNLELVTDGSEVT